MIDSRSYYQAVMRGRYIKGEITREQLDEALSQNRQGKQMGVVVRNAFVHRPTIQTT